MGTRSEALDNARRLVHLEQHLGGLFELDLQRAALHSAGVLLNAANWTYWLSQFVVVAIAVIWIYLRRPDIYPRLRNTFIVANTIGLAGYVLFPLAPPRLLPAYGFVDTLTRATTFNHRTGIIELFANPYAAMPSLHAADALILGVALAVAVRPLILRCLFLLWPVWVCYSLIATGNHYWLDIAAGAALAAFAAWLVGVRGLRSRLARVPAARRRSRTVGGDRGVSRHRAVSQVSGQAASQLDRAAPGLAEGKLQAVGLEVRAQRPPARPRKDGRQSHRVARRL